MKKVLTIVAVFAGLVLTAYTTFFLTSQFYTPAQGEMSASAKLAEIEAILDQYFVDEYDPEQIADAAADAAVKATGDRWSYYIPASEYQTYEEHVQNAYAGVGMTILDWDGEGFPVASVAENSPAENGGVQVGDKLCCADGVDLTGMEISEVQQMVKGEPNTPILLTFLRDGNQLDVTLQRAIIEQTVAYGEMVTDEIGCITITNFDNNSAEQTISAIEQLRKSGAKGLIFDVRMNPGGLRSEMVEVLDYLLPEGDVFRGVTYDGNESVDRSDANCVSLPMVVIVDSDSYSAAEFFAAALQEYGWAEVVGEQTSGKGNFQYTFTLADGSAVAISVGKYFTNSGRSLDGVGVTPDAEVSLTEEDRKLLYSGLLSVEDDVQLQRAMEILTKKIS